MGGGLWVACVASPQVCVGVRVVGKWLTRKASRRLWRAMPRYSFCALRPHKYHHREAFVLSSAGWNQEAGGHLHSATLVDAVVCLTRVLLPTIADLDGFAHTDRTPSPSHTQCVERMAERRARFRSRRTRIIAPARAAVASIDCAASISRSWSSASSIKSVCTLGGAGALGATCATGGMAGGYCR
jgi:hypothetical protein